MSKTIFIFTLIFCFMFSSTTIAEQPSKYIVGILDFPPFYVVKSESDVSGSMTEIVKKTLNKAGINYTITGLPPKRLYKSLAEGYVHIWMGIKGVPDYDEQVLYSKIQTQTIDICVYTLTDKPPVNSLQDLKGKKILTIRGYGYGGIIKFIEDPMNNVVVDATDGHELAFKKLLKNRSDYLLEYRQPAEVTITKEKITGLKRYDLKSIPIQFIVSKKAPDAENLLKKIDTAYLKLRVSGALK